MRFYQALSDSQAETCAVRQPLLTSSCGARPGRVRAPKGLKNVGSIFRGDALACVCYGNLHSFGCGCSRHRYRAAGWRVAQGIDQEVEQHLSYAVRIGLGRRECVGISDIQAEAMAIGIGWVGDLVSAVGGEEIFPEVGCDKKTDLAGIYQRPAWRQVPAVQRGHVFEIEFDLVLQTGPRLIEGARQHRP